MTKNDVAYDKGYAVGISGGTVFEMPYKMAQGSPERLEGFAWRRGFTAGQLVKK
jgi:ribosome modulation factor